MIRLHQGVTFAILPLIATAGLAQEAVKPVVLKDLPHPWDRYRVDPYIAAAIALQTDPKATRDVLRKLAKDADDRVKGAHAALGDSKLTGDARQKLLTDIYYRDADKVIVLCRMLFAAKPKGEFRRPGLGGPAFPGGGNPKDWPLEPIELVDGVPFLVVLGYTLGGSPEKVSSYLDYCLDNCDWTSERYQPKDKEAKEKALAKLLADKRWEEALKKGEKEFLSSQIK